ncbi:MAG: CBS domain-containing protein [Sulfuricellaceae bacterium]
MTIANIPYRSPALCIDPDATLMEALRLMLEKEINHVPLCDAERRFCGMVSTNAILQELIPISARSEHGLTDLKFAGDATRLLTAHLRDLGKNTVRDTAKTATPVLNENCPLLEAALLLTQSTAPLPVIGADGKLRGMLSRRALLDYLVREAETAYAR